MNQVNCNPNRDVYKRIINIPHGGKKRAWQEIYIYCIVWYCIVYLYCGTCNVLYICVCILGGYMYCTFRCIFGGEFRYRVFIKES